MQRTLTSGIRLRVRLGDDRGRIDERHRRGGHADARSGRAEGERRRENRRRARWPDERADAHRQAGAADRVLHEAIAHNREREGAGEERELHARGERVARVLRRDREQRPVPEIERIGTVTDVPQGTDGERSEAAGDDERGAPGREERGVARERSRAREADRCGGDRGKADPTHGARDPESRCRDREHRAESELPRAGRRREVGGGGRRARLADRPGERGEPAGAGDEDEREPAAPRAEENRGQERRPDEVELLLDRERPEVQERRRRLRLREVVAPDPREVDIRAERGGPEAVRDRFPSPNEVEQVASSEVGDEQRQRRRGQDPPRPPNVEAGERDRPAPLGLREQDPGDQEPGEDEEYVHTDETAAEEGHARVAERDEQNRNRPETLDVVATLHVSLSRRP
jgi:hypothetical protein